MTVEEIWRGKDDDQLVLAAKQLLDYTAEGQAIILAELDRRHIERPALETPDTSRWPSRVYHQVGGVVVFFCFWQLVIAPIQALRLLGFLIALAIYNGPVEVSRLTVALAVAGIALIVFGMVAAIQLLRIRPNAVKLTLLYWVSTVVYQVFGAMATLVFGQPLQISQIEDVVLAAALAAAWATYFKMSKRVAATYRS